MDNALLRPMFMFIEANSVSMDDVNNDLLLLTVIFPDTVTGVVACPKMIPFANTLPMFMVSLMVSIFLKKAMPLPVVEILPFNNVIFP